MHPLFAPFLMLTAIVTAINRGDSIPILGDLLNPKSKAAPRLQAQPLVPHDRIAMVTYLQGGARYFKDRVCFALFESMKRLALENATAQGRAVPPGTYRLVPYTEGARRASDAVIEAAEKGFHALVSVASALDEYRAVDRIIMFALEAKAAHAGTQFAILGPIELATNATVTSSTSSSSSSSAPETARAGVATESLELALERAERDGLPATLVKNALASPDASPTMLEQTAGTLPQYPAIARALRERANVLRAREQLEDALTKPHATPHTNGALESRPATIITVEAEETKAP